MPFGGRFTPLCTRDFFYYESDTKLQRIRNEKESYPTVFIILYSCDCDQKANDLFDLLMKGRCISDGVKKYE